MRAPRSAIASMNRASPARSLPARSMDRKRSMYHCEWPGLAATFCIQMLCSTMTPLSAGQDDRVFKVMFFSPRIAPNTGNAIRMVAATGCELHLVEPLGFDLSEPKLRRAGLDYHDLASVTVHADLSAAWDAVSPARVFAFTAHAQSSFADVSYRPGDVLMFGPEPSGLDAATLADPHITAQLRIPMLAGRRSLNLSNAAAVVVYEMWRQHGFSGAV